MSRLRKILSGERASDAPVAVAPEQTAVAVAEPVREPEPTTDLRDALAESLRAEAPGSAPAPDPNEPPALGPRVRVRALRDIVHTWPNGNTYTWKEGTEFTVGSELALVFLGYARHGHLRNVACAELVYADVPESLRPELGANVRVRYVRDLLGRTERDDRHQGDVAILDRLTALHLLRKCSVEIIDRDVQIEPVRITEEAYQHDRRGGR